MTNAERQINRLTNTQLKEFITVRHYEGKNIDKDNLNKTITNYLSALLVLEEFMVLEYGLKKEGLRDFDFFNITAQVVDKYIDYRVLVVAKSMESDLDNPENVKVIGFILLQDKIREEAPDTLKYFKEQGVKVKIISGDNFKTVTSIARRAGLVDALGMDASLLTEDNICENVKKYDVFGRVKPEQKKMIVESLQKEGHVVAMTGDGVNDVLALKQSDCSIAVASGTDAAKNVSQLVLLDSNFSSLPKVVAEGRRTINNVIINKDYFYINIGCYLFIYEK